MIQFAITIFISAFLLFQVQPIIARYILPWFGGSPAVWSTSMLFFQIGLLLGYTYAHLISKYLGTKKQVILHFILLGLSLLLLPITPSEALKPNGIDAPAINIILLLLSTVGIPYMLLSSTGPLVQQWFSKKYPDKSPYRLYALSNFGSLLALLSYPFIVEPNFGLNTQTIFWSIGYGVFILMCGWAGITVYNSLSNLSPDLKQVNSTKEEKMSLWDPLLWLGFSASGSILLLAATNFITQDVAVVPFLWILPLSLYLITFIIAFDSPRWYVRWFWIPLLVVISIKIFRMLAAHYNFSSLPLTGQLFFYLGGMFLALMVAHGEMVRLKPPVKHLTFFYLMVSLGGAIGGVFVTFIAPEIFSDFWEWPLGFILVLLLTAVSIMRKPGFDIPVFISSKLPKSEFSAWMPALVTMFLITISVHYLKKTSSFQDSFSKGVLASERNFYGVLRVIESDKGTSLHKYEMFHGQIRHGTQFQDPKKMRIPTDYYIPLSGVGLAIHQHPKALNSQGINMGIIGLGAGTIGSYIKPKDKYVYYEIDSGVERLAREYFTYLSDGANQIDVIIGDGRVSMERELKEQGSRKFDILTVDAFSGDAIPVHLLTQEAFELYFKHLSDDGILAMHITNRYIDLKPLVYNMAKKFNKKSILIKVKKDRPKNIARSTWVLISNNQEFMQNPEVLKNVTPWSDSVHEKNIIWTDNYSNLIKLLKEK